MNNLAKFEHLFEDVRRGFATANICQGASFWSEVRSSISLNTILTKTNDQSLKCGKNFGLKSDASSPAVFFFREFPFFDICARCERILALLVFVLVRVLVEHRYFVAERFLERRNSHWILRFLSTSVFFNCAAKLIPRVLCISNIFTQNCCN